MQEFFVKNYLYCSHESSFPSDWYRGYLLSLYSFAKNSKDSIARRKRPVNFLKWLLPDFLSAEGTSPVLSFR